jgi:hypothetical protein
MAGDWVMSAVIPGVQAAHQGCGKLVELQKLIGLLNVDLGFSGSVGPQIGSPS